MSADPPLNPPVHQAPPSAPRATRPRWAVGAVAAVVLLAAGMGAVLGSYLVNARGASMSAVATHVPADAFLYVEVRMDLPGDQRTRLREVLARFPGIDPDIVLGPELDAFLDGALADAGVAYDYSSDVRAWFDGQLSLAVLDYPSGDPMRVELPGVVVALGSTDAAAATSLTDAVRSDVGMGAPFSSTTHDGVTIWSLDLDPWTAEMMGGAGFAYAVTDETVLLSMSRDDLVTALDVRAGRRDGLSGRSELQTFLPRLAADPALLMVVDSEPMIAQLRADMAAIEPALADALGTMLEGQPTFSVMTGRFVSDGLRLEAISAAPTGVYAMRNARRDLAGAIPDDAIFYAESGNLGPILAQLVATTKATMAADPMGADQLAEVETFEMALGTTLESFVEWIGDGALAIGWDGQEPYLGAVLDADDAEAAGARLAQLTALARLALLDPQSATTVTVDERVVSGVDVTTIRVAMPPDASMMNLDELAIEYALDQGRVLIGVGDRFMERSLTVDDGDRLAGNARFVAAIDGVGGFDAAAVTYLDLRGLRLAVEAAAPDELGPEYRSTVLPYLEPFSHLAGVTRMDGERSVSSMAIVLGEP
jgi:hypothetical protein